MANIVEALRIRSAAKVNLMLRVGPTRPDGFHPLVSWFCRIGLADELSFRPAQGLNVLLTCDRPGVPCDQTNLVMRAAELLRPLATKPIGLRIHITKRIPMGGGLGGGSSNAAAALEAISQIWHCRSDASMLSRLAAQLGSDVPFFLNGPSAICRGRGEQVSPFARPRATAVLLLLPDITMPTPMVYRVFDQIGPGSDLDAVALPRPDMRAEELLPTLVNDLESPAFAISPELKRLRETTEGILGRPVRMSGSGSTLFTIYDDIAEAESAQTRIAAQMRIKAVPTALCAAD